MAQSAQALTIGDEFADQGPSRFYGARDQQRFLP